MNNKGDFIRMVWKEKKRGVLFIPPRYLGGKRHLELF
jgi:hypothetical protein